MPLIDRPLNENKDEDKQIKLSRLDRFMMAGYSVKALTGVVGGSLVLDSTHPYITLTALGVGAVSAELIAYIQRKIK